MATPEGNVKIPARNYAKDKGYIDIPLASPGNRSVPDDLLIGFGLVFAIEFKRPKGKPRKQQAKRIRDLISAGLPTYVFDNLQEFKSFIDKITPTAPVEDDKVVRKKT